MLMLGYTLAALVAAIRRPDWVSAVFLIALGLSIYIGMVADEKELPVALSLAEMAMSLTLLFGCIQSVNERGWTPKTRRAQIIGLIGGVKIIVWFGFTSGKVMHDPVTIPYHISAIINGGFILQICAAGGFIDDIIARIIDYRSRVWDKLLCRLGYRKVA